jgi:hypothetical protein
MNLNNWKVKEKINLLYENQQQILIVVLLTNFVIEVVKTQNICI